MINYSSWPKKKINVTSLRLDYSNPRLSDTNRRVSQNEIIDYLLDKEKVYELSQSIVAHGFFLNEQPIVFREGGKYYVLEGNRRVTACKIIINPDLIKNPSKRNNLKKSISQFDIAIIEKLECIVAPSREDADFMIVNRHTGGSVVQKWDKTKQDRFIYNRFIAGETVDEMASRLPMTKSEIRNSIKRNNVYQELCKLELDESIKKQILDETTFSITNVERAYQSSDGLEFMGFEFDETNFKLIKKLPKEEFVKRLTRIAVDSVTGKIDSRKLNSDADKKKYFDELIQSGEFDSEVKPDLKYNEDEKPEPEPEPIVEPDDIPKRNQSVAKATNLMPSNTHLVTGIEKIDTIFKELRTLNVKTHTNAVGVLFRSYLDMIAYQFLKKNNGLNDLKLERINKLVADNSKKLNRIKGNFSKHNTTLLDGIEDDILKKLVAINDNLENPNQVPSLKLMLGHIASSDSLISDAKLVQALKGYLNSNNKFLSHDDFNLIVHNEYFFTDAEELKKMWSQMFPIISYFVSKIK